MIMSNGIITPALKASAYCLSGDNWNSHNFDFELGILPLYSSDYWVPLMTIGDKNIGVQEIPSLNQYVTAVDVLLGKNNLETGIAIATLYKGYGTEAINVDETIAKTEKLNKDNYKDFSKVETAIDGVVRGKNITQQDEVDAMVKAINDAIIALEKKDEIVKPKTNDAQVPNTRNHNLIIIYGTLISVSILCLSSLLKRRY
ncbi:hypothetical protein [Thomasclavelia cocleata]|uniref:hypothetical protein n=6 Tax=Thomasclavelia cocleata TaxID=69824 RepID=UPI00255B24E5|nr:hypothetical protein [Thomasclavelia cocleata]